MKVHGTFKKICVILQNVKIPKNKIQIKLSLATSNYTADKRYALVDTDIINDKTYINRVYHIISLHLWYQSYISQNTDNTSQLSTYNITPLFLIMIITVDRKQITLCNINNILLDIRAIFINTSTKLAKALLLMVYLQLLVHQHYNELLVKVSVFVLTPCSMQSGRSSFTTPPRCNTSITHTLTRW